jgi:hypothetical protein
MATRRESQQHMKQKFVDWLKFEFLSLAKVSSEGKCEHKFKFNYIYSKNSNETKEYNQFKRAKIYKFLI